MRKAIAWPLLLAGAISGCSLTPELQRPPLPVADSYPVETAGSARAAVDTGWREFFADPQLQDLIAAALEHNRDLRIAALNIEAARAQYRIQGAQRLPSVNAQAEFSRTHTPESVSPTGSGVTANQYQVGLGIAAFELDFFGRVRSLSDAALAEYLATEEAARSAQISLVAEVARAYFAERALAERLQLAERSRAARENSYRLAQQRFAVGAASALELRQYETLLESARVSTAALARERAQAVNALTLLVGRPVKLEADAGLSEQELVADLPAGLPSELLTQRPDIRAAEQRLISANASIGAARAAFFPRVSLTGAVGSVSRDLDDLFGSGSGMWSFMPQISLPIFDGGRNRANLSLAEVRKDQAVASYERAIQVAFREVADALVARDALMEQEAAQSRLRAAQAERLSLAEERYRAGVVSYLEVLDAQRELFDAEQAMVQVRLQRLTNAVDLYRALGGGLKEHGTAPVAQRAPGVATGAES